MNRDFSPVQHACYSPVKLPSNNDKRIALVHSYKGREILFEVNHDGWYYRGLLKDTEADYYIVEWLYNGLKRKGKNKTIEEAPIKDLTALLVRVV